MIKKYETVSKYRYINNLDEMKLLGYSCLSKPYSMNYEKALAERDSMKVEEQSTLEG